MSTVLVTGGSGFVGVHTILQLLAAGHAVRTTVRHPDRSKDVLAMLRQGGGARTAETQDALTNLAQHCKTARPARSE